jgi:hypothetical protein
MIWIALYIWSDLWEMKFNTNKCKAIHYGKDNPNIIYSMNNTEFHEVNEGKDLGILFQKDLKFSQHISSKINKSNSILGLIGRYFLIWTVINL